MSHFRIPDEDVVLYNSVFDDQDILERKPLSEHLSQIVDNITDPLVITLDGPWGTGKTHFLTRWVGAHSLQNGGIARTVYFDAFAHDYISDPLTSIVGTIAERFPPDAASKVTRLKNAVFKLAKPTAKLALAAGTAGASALAGDIGDALLGAIKDESQEAIDAYWNKERSRLLAMQDFRATIESLANPENKEKTSPLAIVIDELDRCRPDYALEVLEIIKHFFSVPNVHFILGVNMESLENSVKYRYGDNIDSYKYLQKFISFSLSLPDAISRADHKRSEMIYAKHLSAKHKFSHDKIQYVNDILEKISQHHKISMRDLDKIFSIAAILPTNPYKSDRDGFFLSVLSTMLISKVIDQKFYQKIINKNLETLDLFHFFNSSAESIESQINSGKILRITKLMAIFWQYSNHGARTSVLDDKAFAHLQIYDSWEREDFIPELHREFISKIGRI